MEAKRLADEGDAETKKKEGKRSLEEVLYDPERFNPFDKEEIKKHEEGEKPMKPRRRLTVKR